MFAGPASMYLPLSATVDELPRRLPRFRGDRRSLACKVYSRLYVQYLELRNPTLHKLRGQLAYAACPKLCISVDGFRPRRHYIYREEMSPFQSPWFLDATPEYGQMSLY